MLAQTNLMSRIEGFCIKEVGNNVIEFTIKADILIEELAKRKNQRGFVDGKFIRLKQKSEKGVTHVAIQSDVQTPA